MQRKNPLAPKNGDCLSRFPLSGFPYFPPLALAFDHTTELTLIDFEYHVELREFNFRSRSIWALDLAAFAAAVIRCYSISIGDHYVGAALCSVRTYR